MCGGIIVGALAFLLVGKVIGCAIRRHRYDRCGYGYGGGHGGCGGYEYEGEDGGGGGGCGTRGRWGRGGGGPFWARHHGWHERRGRRGGSSFREGVGKRWMLRFLFERLDTTPGQEKVIASSFDVIREALSKTKGAFSKTRSTIAGAVRDDEFGHEKIGEAWVSHDLALEKARLEITSELQKIHDALDERQRKILADLIESGPGIFGGRGFETAGEAEDKAAGDENEGTET